MEKKDWDCIDFDLFMKKRSIDIILGRVFEAFSVFKTAFIWELYIHNLSAVS